MSYPKPENESERLEFLHSLSLLDTAQDENLERIVSLCRSVFDMPVADISVIDSDRQWFKTMQGLGICETDRELAFCNYPVASGQPLEVLDASIHPDFKNNTVVTGEPFIRYYFGVPIFIDGFAIGALCLIDSKPRDPISNQGREIMKQFGLMVERELKIQRVLKSAVSRLPNII
jgi:GAF domain-containing protein